MLPFIVTHCKPLWLLVRECKNKEKHRGQSLGECKKIRRIGLRLRALASSRAGGSWCCPVPGELSPPGAIACAPVQRYGKSEAPSMPNTLPDSLFWTPRPPQVYVLQANEAIAQDGKRRIADVVAELGIRRGSVRVELARGERTLSFSSAFADPYKDGVHAALRCGGKEPVWADANPPFAVESLRRDLPALQSAHGYDVYWRPTLPAAYCSTCAKLVHVERAGDSKSERALAASLTVFGDLSAVRIMAAPSRCKECESLVPYSGFQQYLYRYRACCLCPYVPACLYVTPALPQVLCRYSLHPGCHGGHMCGVPPPLEHAWR